MTDTVKKYVVYYRVSTKSQGDSGLGLEAQERDIALFLENYSDIPFEVIGQFTDIKSGKDANRPELTAAITLAKKEGAELLVAKLDRLSRKVSFIAALMDDKKLALRVATMPTADKFQLHIYAALAEQERDFISLRTKAALKAAKARGTRLGGLRPGTKARNDAAKAKANNYAQSIGSMLMGMRDARMPLRQIADAMNSAGQKTARGGEWGPSQVMYTLRRLDAARQSDEHAAIV